MPFHAGARFSNAASDEALRNPVAQRRKPPKAQERGRTNNLVRTPVAPGSTAPPSVRAPNSVTNVIAPPSAPSTPAVFVPDGSSAEAEDLRAKQLAAAIASIGATFGGNVAQQQALLNELDPRFERLQQENLRLGEVAQRNVFDSFGERGIFRSTLTAQAAQEAVTPYTEAIADAAAIRGQQEQQFKSAIEQFQAQEEAKIVEAQLASEKDAFDFDLYLASLGL